MMLLFLNICNSDTDLFVGALLLWLYGGKVSVVVAVGFDTANNSIIFKCCWIVVGWWRKVYAVIAFVANVVVFYN